jgi:DNA-directed RNA polymerase specialized sigma24 family protein
LTRITLNKCGHRFDYWFAERRHPGREISADRGEEDSAASWEFLGQEPAPEHAAVLEETMAELLQGLSELDCRILELSMQGSSNDEIAAEVGRTRRTVERSLERVRLRLEQMRDGTGEDERRTPS